MVPHFIGNYIFPSVVHTKAPAGCIYNDFINRFVNYLYNISDLEIYTADCPSFTEFRGLHCETNLGYFRFTTPIR